MTRINCVPVQELNYKHLVTEYRELPRVFNLARPAMYVSDKYTLGTGHVKFFYNKLFYCYKRQHELYNEMLRRGYNPRFDPESLLVHKDRAVFLDLWNDWTPTPEAIEINRKRIKERGG